MQTLRETRKEPVSSSRKNRHSDDDLAHQANHLTQRCQRFITQSDGLVEYLCQEVERITRGDAHLIIHGTIDPPFGDEARMVSFPVQYGEISFGKLLCMSSAHLEDSFLDEMKDVAYACALVLFMLEHAFLVRRTHKTDVLPQQPRLTPQEYQVLTWMGRGQKRAEIATKLGITEGTVRKHQQHIYSKLHVSCEQDAVIVGYRLGLFSPIEYVSRV